MHNHTSHLPIVYLTSLIVSSLLTDCGYTRLAATPPKPITPLPDLCVVEFRSSSRLVHMMDAPDDWIEVSSVVRVKNVGHAPFIGTLFVGWTDKREHFRPRAYDHFGPYMPCTLTPGDSVDLLKSWSYPVEQAATPVELTVLTDTRSLPPEDAERFNCGLSPADEERHDNNDTLVVVHPEIR